MVLAGDFLQNPSYFYSEYTHMKRACGSYAADLQTGITMKIRARRMVFAARSFIHLRIYLSCIPFVRRTSSFCIFYTKKKEKDSGPNSLKCMVKESLN